MTALARLRPFPRLASLLAIPAFVVACNQEDPTNLPEWSPADHTNQGSPNPGQIDTSQKRAGMEKLEAKGVNDVVLAAWRTNCVRCHGNAGQGDGPEGRMLRPPDMSDPAWQRTRIESEMKHAIRNGRGRMPPFAQLPEKTVDGLVQLVRMLSRDFDVSKLEAGTDKAEKPGATDKAAGAETPSSPPSPAPPNSKSDD